MNHSCFFLNNNRTNHIEFHYRTDSGKENEKMDFKSFVYIPECFEKRHWGSLIMSKFNIRLLYHSIFNPDLKKKLEKDDKNFLMKWKFNSLLFPGVLPFVYYKSVRIVDRYLERINYFVKNPCRIRRIGFIYILPIVFCITEIYKICTHRRIFMTGKE